MTRQELLDHMKRLNACDEAVAWVTKTKGTPAQLWKTCKRVDWLLWLAAGVGVDRKDIVLAACACARTALKHVPEGEERPRIAIETAEQWARGKATLDEVRAARREASSAAAAYAAYAAYAASASASAASAAAAAAYADAHAAAAAHVAYVAYVAARKRAVARCLTLIRKQIPWSKVEKALKAQTAKRAT